MTSHCSYYRTQSPRLLHFSEKPGTSSSVLVTPPSVPWDPVLHHRQEETRGATQSQNTIDIAVM